MPQFLRTRYVVIVSRGDIAQTGGRSSAPRGWPLAAAPVPPGRREGNRGLRRRATTVTRPQQAYRHGAAGDKAKTVQRDHLIQGMVEPDGYTGIVVQSRDLNDPEAVRQHLLNIAEATGRSDFEIPSQ
jgi:hypothetical protein